MANPAKQKGTGGETELLRVLNIPGLVRTPASSNHDLDLPGDGQPIQVLATRPDRGRWLMTMSVSDFKELWMAAGGAVLYFSPPLAVEVKRYARFSIHSTFEGKFGRTQ